MNSFLAILLIASTATLPGETNFVAAYDQARIGRHADAIELYLGVAKSDPSLAPYAKIRAARSRARAGDEKGAIREIKAVLAEYPEGPWVRWAHHEVAELLSKERATAEAATHYAETVKMSRYLWWVEEVRVEQAMNNLDIPEYKQVAMDYFREVLDTSSWYSKRVEAAEYLSRSDRAEDRIHAALGLIRDNKIQDATRVANAIPNSWLSEPAMERQSRRLAAQLLIANGKRDEGSKQLEALALEFPEESWADEALLFTTIYLIRSEKWDEADRIVEEMIQAHPDSKETREALTRIARAHAKYKHSASAIEWYRKRVKLFPQDNEVGAALLEAGHAYRQENRDQEAIGMYDQLLNDFPNDEHAAEAGFWAGQLLQKNGQTKLAKEHYEKSVAAGLTRYYGYRSQDILAMDFGLPKSKAPMLDITATRSIVRPIPQKGKDPGFASEEFSDNVPLQRLRFFAYNGFLEAEWEAISLIETINDHADPELMYRAIGEAGTAYSAMQWADMNNFGVNEDSTQSVERLRIRYPRPYWEFVSALGAELDLDPYLILSIARQESTYRPGLSSSAGAKGVMQLMPRTAKWLGDTDPKITGDTAQRLDEPRHSLRMGSVYLRQMIDRSGGNIAYALASYNAGPGNFDKWYRRNPNQPVTEFIEEIPFAETQAYVKRILAHYATYKSIYPE